MKKAKQIIKLPGLYLAEAHAANVFGVSVPELRRKVVSKEIKGRICANGEVSISSDDAYFTPGTMARMMHVTKNDVVEWIQSSELKATADGDNYKISYEEYSRFGEFGMWMEKAVDSHFKYMKQSISKGRIIEEVNEGFRRGMKPHIEKAREVVDYLEKLHSHYENKFDILNEKSAIVAGLIIVARIISILQSILNLIEKDELVESYP